MLENIVSTTTTTAADYDFATDYNSGVYQSTFNLVYNLGLDLELYRDSLLKSQYIYCRFGYTLTSDTNVQVDPTTENYFLKSGEKHTIQAKGFIQFESIMATTTTTSTGTTVQPPFRAEQMGSLLRPQKLLDVRSAIRDNPNLTPEEAGLPAVEKEAVAQIVKTQRDLGFKGVTSGEYNRTRFWGLFWDELEGTVRLQDADASMFRLYHPDVVSLIEQDRKVMPGDSVIAGSKIRHPGPEKVKSNLHELKLVQEATPREEWGNIKLTMITPAVRI